MTGKSEKVSNEMQVRESRHSLRPACYLPWRICATSPSLLHSLSASDTKDKPGPYEIPTHCRLHLPQHCETSHTTSTTLLVKGVYVTMTSTGLLKLPPEIRNRIYQLVLQPYRINLTRNNDVNRLSNIRRIVHNDHFALRSVCNSVRMETSSMLPSPTLSVFQCIALVKYWRIPKSLAVNIRRLVIDDTTALCLDLWFTLKLLPQLASIEIHVSPDYVAHESSGSFQHWSILGLDIAELITAPYDSEHLRESMQHHPVSYPLPHILKRWRRLLQNLSPLPEITLKHRLVLGGASHTVAWLPSGLDVILVLVRLILVIQRRKRT